MADLQPRGLIQLPAPQPRKNKKAIGCVLGGVGVLVFGIVLWQMRGGKPSLSREMVDRPVAEMKAREMPSQLRDDLKYPSSYANVPLHAQTMPEPSPAQAIPDTTMTSMQMTSSQRMRTSLQGTVDVPASPNGAGGDKKPPRGTGQEKQGGGQAQVRTAATSTQAPNWRWFSTPPQAQGDILTPPFAEDQKKMAEQGSQSEIFTKAVWEAPAHPEQILYASQLVYGQLLQNMNSDIPGTVRIKVIEDVADKWGLGYVLIPMDTTFIAKQTGQAQYGDNRFHLEVYAGELPNGTMLALQGQVGDFGGATGVEAKVNNHYGQLLLGTGLSAILSLSARVPFGNSDTYRPQLPEELAKNIGQDINSSGQAIIQRELMRRPTLTQLAGYPVTLQFAKPISFMSPPKKVNK